MAGPHSAEWWTACDDAWVISELAVEGRHEPGSGPDWFEAYVFDFVATDGSSGGTLGVCLFPNRRAATVWVGAVGLDERYLAIAEQSVPVPRDLEFRSSGLWVDIACLVPFDHVQLGLEAFAVGMDDPADALGRMWGDRVPLGFDLGWDTTGAVAVPSGDANSLVVEGYELACAVHGEILVGEGAIDLDGFGSRRHIWGIAHPWTKPWARTVRARGVQATMPADAAMLAAAPLRVTLVTGDEFRLSGGLHRLSDTEDSLAWIERSTPC